MDQLITEENCNGDENTTYQNLWDTAKAILRGKLYKPWAYILKTQKDFKQPNTSPQTPIKTREPKPKTSRRETTKIRAKINEIETKKKKPTYKELGLWKNK
jgi:hypothetical protein